MGGVGKTTVAQACYDNLRDSADANANDDTKFHFVNRVGQNGVNDQDRVEGLVRELYSKLLSEDSLSREDLDKEYRRGRLLKTRVLVVLDDVHTPSQLDELLLQEATDPRKLFAPGSRIIVTTRNRRVLEHVKAKIHSVGPLDVDESLQLFKLHAFSLGSPFDDDDDDGGRNDDLSHKVVSYCNGNPLALRVLGGALSYKDNKYWESFVLKLGKTQEAAIHHVLRTSYEELRDVKDKRLFLDMACFFSGHWRSLLVKYMETVDESAYSRVEDLIGKSLLASVFDQSEGEILVVHDLLKEMAWNIVNEEEDLGRRSRLNDPADIHNLLTNWKGHRATEGIRLNLSKVKMMSLKANAFEGMNSLRWLNFFLPKGFGSRHRKIIVSEGILNSLPNELRGLRWDQFPLASLPGGFSPDELAYLVISHSPIKTCWKENQPELEKLSKLSLTSCENLTVIPDLRKSANLEHLVLEKCKSLVEVPDSIQYLVELVRLEVRDCENIERVPDRLNSNVLKHLILVNCPKVTHCPEVDSGVLESLDLDGTPIDELPNAIYKVKQGGVVCLYGPSITSFPQLSTSLKLLRLRNTAIRGIELDHRRRQGSNLPKFEQLHLLHNSQLKTLSRSIWNMVTVELTIEWCPLIKSLPEISRVPVGDLTRLIISGCEGLESLPSGINHLKSLNYLRCYGTTMKSLPNIEELDKITHLALSSSSRIESVPPNIHKLANLSCLMLIRCWGIQYLPELPPNLDFMDVSCCKSLLALPSNVGSLRWRCLCFVECPKLDMNLPEELVKNFPQQALSSPHSKGMLQYSGSEIPKWFDYKSTENNNEDSSCVTVKLPHPNSSRRHRGVVKGIAFGVVCSSDSGPALLSIRCECSIGSSAAAASWRSPFLLGLSSSDVVYMCFDKNSFGETDEGVRGGGEPWYVKYAGLDVCFRIRFEAKRGGDLNKLKKAKCKSIGVSLLY
ncbi:unnamed protein product [Linum tenue]|uniref:NB-ARC domain-containing protein n=1 Tax=Linum tenue TaxID=586396 RepID=A0AAV0MBY2_9ROSI|nr:unnamed protein product [Linum tenue]